MTTAITSPPVAAVPAAAGDVRSNAADASQPIAFELDAPADGACWYFGGAFVGFAADPSNACRLSVYVRLADDSDDDFLLFAAPLTRGGPAPVYLPRARQAPAGRPLRFSLDADAGGAAAYLLPDVWQGVP